MENRLTGSTVIRSLKFDTRFQESIFVTNSPGVRHQMKVETKVSGIKRKLPDKCTREVSLPQSLFCST